MIKIKVAPPDSAMPVTPASVALQYLQPGSLNLTALPPLSLYVHLSLIHI